jgi:hypothetical protein
MLMPDLKYVIGKFRTITLISDFKYSWVLIPGTFLLGKVTLTIAYLITLGYLFLGIAIVSDIFMDAIEMITSQTK